MKKLFSLLFAIVASMSFVQAETYSDYCGAEGDNLIWSYNTEDSILTISGSGAMANYHSTYDYAPWHSYRKNIKEIVINDGTTTIGRDAFVNCSQLISITIPNSVDSIGDGAFFGCSMLEQITIPNRVKTIGDQTFYGCSNLTSVVLPDSLKQIKSGAFRQCKKLSSINIPQTLTIMEESVFSFCSSLTSMVLPAGLIYLGNNAFYNCSGITTFTCYAIIPPNSYPVAYMGTFDGIDKSIPLYVPAQSVEQYKAAEGWSEFTNILPIAGDWNPEHPNNPGNYRLTLEVEDTLQGYTIGSGLYEQGATAHIEAVAKDGYEFVKWSDNDSNAVRDIVIARDCTLIADFTERYYWVQFVNYDDEILQTTQELYGAIPAYRGATPVHPASAIHEYTFAGWYPEIGPVTRDIVYTARYDTIFLGEEIVYVWDKKNITELPVGKNSHIIVYGNGELYVSQPTTVKALTIEKDTACGQVTNISLLTAESIDLVQSFIPEKGDISSRWFAFGVPFEVSVANGISKADANTPAYYGSDYVIDEYDGVLRADTQDGWKRVSATATLYPGKLYMLSSREAYSWRFTASNPSAVTNSTWTVSVQACPSAFGDHHAGWNGIANPLTYEAYAYASNIPYATVYDNYYGVYRVVQMNNQFWKTGDPFFVQTPRNNTVYFAGAGAGIISGGDDIIDAYASRRISASETAAPTVIELASTHYTDKAYINTVSDKQDSYTIGMDLEKLQVSNPSVPQVWINAYGTHLAAYARTSEMENVPMTLGFYAPTDGTYTLSISNLSGEESVCLTQNGTAISDLTNQSCEISLHAGINTGYALTVSKTPAIVTGLENAAASHTSTRKLIRDGQILILRGDHTYTLTGEEVK